MLRPPRMSRDEHWLSMLVFLSRAETLENIKVLRLCEKKDLEGGPPAFLLAEIDRLKLLEKTTIERLDQKLLKLELHNLRASTTANMTNIPPALSAEARIYNARKKPRPKCSAIKRKFGDVDWMSNALQQSEKLVLHDGRSSTSKKKPLSYV